MTGIAAGAVTLTASAPGLQSATTTGLTVSANLIVLGTGVVLTAGQGPQPLPVSLSQPAATFAQIVLTSSNPAVATVTQTVSISTGQLGPVNANPDRGFTRCRHDHSDRTEPRTRCDHGLRRWRAGQPHVDRRRQHRLVDCRQLESCCRADRGGQREHSSDCGATHDHCQLVGQAPAGQHWCDGDDGLCDEPHGSGHRHRPGPNRRRAGHSRWKRRRVRQP